MILITDEQRQVLEEHGAPMPLLDAKTGKSYIVMPVSLSSRAPFLCNASIPGIDAIVDGEVPSEAVENLALLLKSMIERKER